MFLGNHITWQYLGDAIELMWTLKHVRGVCNGQYHEYYDFVILEDRARETMGDSLVVRRIWMGVRALVS